MGRPRSPLSEDIELSWRRSSLSGLSRDAPLAVVIDEGAERDSQLARAAKAALAQMLQDLDGVPALVLLSDSKCRVLKVLATDRHVATLVAGLGVDVGMRCSEEVYGTNSIGTARELGRAVAIRGEEHFKSVLHNVACYGAPIMDLRTRRIAGVLGLSSALSDDNPLYAPLLRRVVGEIENRLYEDCSSREVRMLSAFRAAGRRGQAVVALGDEYVLSSNAALNMLAPGDYPAIVAWAEHSGSTDPQVAKMTLASGQVVCLAQAEDDFRVVRLDAETDSVVRPARPTRWPLLLVGEVGSGRTSTARRAFGEIAAAEFDAADATERDERWVGRVSSLLRRSAGAVLIENIHVLPERHAIRLAHALRDATCRVVLTAAPGPPPLGVHAAFLACAGERRDLLPLRQRRHEIPLLAQEMLAVRRPDGALRLSRSTLQILAAQPWPGNLSELDRVIAAMSSQRQAGLLGPVDIPTSHRGASRPPDPRQQAETDTILSALQATGGNKVRAAALLGISRATLYNRLRALRIDAQASGYTLPARVPCR